MIFSGASMVSVFYQRGMETLLMGRLAVKNRQILFEYEGPFLKTGLDLSPFKLPLKGGVIACSDPLFDGLFGLFNDSLPDGWGRLLLDRKLMTLGINPGNLSPLDRLCYVGRSGMGGLFYEPNLSEPLLNVPHDLDDVAHKVMQFQEDDVDQFLDELIFMTHSSCGVRPKIIISRGDGIEWLVKFGVRTDPKDIGPIEYAYHLMAMSAGLEMSPADLLPSRKGAGYFATQLFDRSGSYRTHMHTVSGLLHADHRIPSLDYGTIMKLTVLLTKDVRQCQAQFKAAVFNVLAHNRDDHGKNFSFLMDWDGAWRVSPAYDLTFSSGPFGEHCTTIMGEGRKPTFAHLLKLAEVGGIHQLDALKIIRDIQSVISKWPHFAEKAGVGKHSASRIQDAFDHVANAFV